MVWAILNRGVFKRSSTFFVVTAIGSFFFERSFEVLVDYIFETRNKGKLWKDVKHRFEKPKEEIE